MVVVDNFSFQLVNAETKEPFKEHTGADGKVYAEVEPDIDYFMQIKVSSSDSSTEYCAKYIVDGKMLTVTQHFHFEPKNLDKTLIHGLWSRENDTETHQALKFRPLCLRMPRCQIQLVKQGDGKSKALRSGKGTTLECFEDDGARRFVEKGRHLKTITINYCTAVGLIHAGVFKKPKGFGKAPLRSSTASDSKDIDIKPKRIKLAGRVVNGTQVEADKEFDLFDLTTLSESQD
ncbi:expressed unknown protein [Seminavis robusta]|uniref:Uncharacterized protein n=1 Tax=Seminavis robusta TaxID=568900 RepID=A0A9N8DN63_9STRA|nr:expressed unknown protein [Seminavis robusta]|eukprot:Sro253_g099960.1 n/a (233) ;mRNA; r:59662-60461